MTLQIFRKAAYQITSSELSEVPKITVDATNLEEFVGKERFPSDRLYEETPAGVVSAYFL